MTDYTSYLAFAEKLADAAGDITRKYFRKAVWVDIKDDASPVTIADREAEKAMRELIASVYPDHGIVGEEYGNRNEDVEFAWVLDPIDGTVSFITGRPVFTTLIAMLHHGQPVVGVIDQSVIGDRWMGVKNSPTIFRNSTAATSRISQLSDATLTTTSPYLFTPQEKEVFEELRQNCKRVVMSNDGYGYGILASGFSDLVVEAGMKPYDYLPLVAVVEGAGGVITDWQGQKLTLESNGRVLAAANETLHAQALEILKKIAE